MNKILEIVKKQESPKFVKDSTKLLVVSGSHAYGCSKPESDNDVYGFCVPPEDDVFSLLRGQIEGFGRQNQRFEQWHQVGVFDGEQEYDFTVYSIVKYFQLMMENNPNMLDSLFVPSDCVLYEDEIGKFVRENRRLFLHRGAYHKFIGYSFAQAKKMKLKVPKEESKRFEDYNRMGYCVKYATHLVRLMFEGEQLLIEGDIDLRRHSNTLKKIRAGEWSLEEVETFFAKYEEKLKLLYEKSHLPWGPEEKKIKELLVECLKMEYGDKEYFRYFEVK